MFKCFVALLFIGAVVARDAPLSRRQHLHQILTEECTKYGHPEKVAEVEAAVDRSVECLTGALDTVAIRDLQLNPRNVDEASINVVQKTCNKKDDVMACYNRLINDMAPCLEPESGVERNTKALTGFVNYICDNEAQNFVEFIRDGALDCMKNKTTALETCTRPTLALQLSHRTVITLGEACGLFERMSDCFVSTLAECPHRSTAKFISKILHFINEGSRCGVSDPNMKVEIAQIQVEDEVDSNTV